MFRLNSDNAVLSILLCLSFTLLGSSCAYRPPFKTSIPHSEVDSFRESITLCSEYDIEVAPVKKTEPNSLLPFIQCLQEGLMAHSSKGQPIFQVFFEELNVLMSDLDGETFSRKQGLQIETAIQSAFKSLWQEGLSTQSQYTSWERENLYDIFPRTAELLGARQWVTRLEVAPADVALERLKGNIADLASSDELQKIPKEKISGEWCRRYRKLKAEVISLAEDRRNYLDNLPLLLARERKLVESQWQNRYEKRIQAALTEVKAIREAEVFVYMCSMRASERVL